MTNIIDPTVYDSDKKNYWKNYCELFSPLVDKNVKLLELGVHKGGSLLLWQDYFQKGHIIGLDIEPVEIENASGRIRVYQGFQHDTALLDDIGRQEAEPGGFDIIIDDASHIGDFTRISFWHLFNNWLKPGGLYVIEDWGTGYWDVWPDGRRYRPRSASRMDSMSDAVLRKMGKGRQKTRLKHNLLQTILKTRKWLRPFLGRTDHSFGMVGFIKELVDECAMGDITDPTHGVPPYRPSKFKRMQIFPGQVFIVKNREVAA